MQTLNINREDLRESLVYGLNILAFTGTPFIVLAMAANICNAYLYTRKPEDEKTETPEQRFREASVITTGVNATVLLGCATLISNPMLAVALFVGAQSLTTSAAMFYSNPSNYCDTDMLIQAIALIKDVSVAMTFFGPGFSSFLAGAGYATEILFYLFLDNDLDANVVSFFSKAVTPYFMLLTALSYATPGIDGCILMAFLAPAAAAIVDKLGEYLIDEDHKSNFHFSLSL